VPSELHANRMQWLIRLRYTLLCVCYVDIWYAPIYLVTCLLCEDLVCNDLSGYVAECGHSATYPDRSVHNRRPHNKHVTR
jgi:hypothetical protein